jgi:hypothetical protein
MKATELRIGNLVFEDGIVNAITLIAEDSGQLLTPQGNTISCRMETLKPIPLTEKWLLKFGFEAYGDNNEYFQHPSTSVFELLDQGVDYRVYSASSDTLCALTNEELTINQ